MNCGYQRAQPDRALSIELIELYAAATPMKSSIGGLSPDHIQQLIRQEHLGDLGARSRFLHQHQSPIAVQDGWYPGFIPGNADPVGISDN
jgi:hypothetical protein